MRLLVVGSLFVVAGLCEIGGGECHGYGTWRVL